MNRSIFVQCNAAIKVACRRKVIERGVAVVGALRDLSLRENQESGAFTIQRKGNTKMSEVGGGKNDQLGLKTHQADSKTSDTSPP